MSFALHPNLQGKAVVAELPLCTVLLEDEQHYPWILLVPKLPNMQRIMDLPHADQHQLILELDWAQKILWDLFAPTQINVAAIGNRTPQLHVHVIARQNGDPAWPATVWDHPTRAVYPPDRKQQVVKQLAAAFTPFASLSPRSQ